ncbi:MAG TPA: GNAT family N-acetyltransferase [Thermoanaerobaculia bacterium]|nr:GNAT family N-acetyltransferase [Thermoanaerobaculia bacterium]
MTETARLVSLVETGLAECFRSFAAFPGAVVDDRAELLAVRTGVPLTFCNGVARARFDGDANARVVETIDWFRAHGVAFRWWLLPSNEPRDLIAFLAANRMRHVYFATGMVADLETMSVPREVDGLAIVRVRDAATLETWADVFAEGFHLTPEMRQTWIAFFTQFGFADDATWRAYLGILDGVPVATSALCLGPELGGVYHVATLPPARGRGVGAAITAAPMRDAAVAGRKTATLQSSEMAIGVYRSLGFVACCDLELYDWKPGNDEGPPAAGAEGPRPQ